jgi:hypothetical protein
MLAAPAAGSLAAWQQWQQWQQWPKNLCGIARSYMMVTWFQQSM